MAPEPGASSIPAEEAEGYHVLSLRDVLQGLRKRVWIILVVAILLAGGAFGYSLAQTSMYESSVRLVVSQNQEGGKSGSLGSDVQGLQQLTKTLAEGVKSRLIAEVVIERLGLQMSPGEFLNNLSVQQVRDTQYIQVDYMDASPERAQQVANTLGEVFSERVSEVSPVGDATTVVVWDPAALPGEPVSPDPGRNGLLGLVLGLMLGLGIALVMEYLDDSWRSSEEAERVLGVPTFGMVPEFEPVASEAEGGY
jgi:capsular polysaccharide biosynthesis protein